MQLHNEIQVIVKLKHSNYRASQIKKNQAATLLKL